MSSEESKNTCKVSFLPDGESAEVPYGMTILDAARKAGVYIDSLCGGEGVCGKCRVIVTEGEVEGGSTEFFTRDEIRKGYVLACEGRVVQDIVVEIPPESQLKSRTVHVDVAEERLGRMTVLERKPATLDPLITRHHLHVPLPSLENHVADLDRLEHTLKTVTGNGELQMGLKVIRTLPSVLRKEQGSVTATTAYRGALTEITEVVPGDSSNRNLAIAVDVGTTTIAAQLLDLTTGKTLGSAGKYNSQGIYGADVIHRILWATDQPGGLQQLHDRIADDINSLIGEMEKQIRISLSDINLIVATGNTTMIHLLLSLNPEYIRKEPFIGVTCQPPPFRAAEAGITINPRGILYCMPCVGAFVGADITAGAMAAGIPESEEPLMLIDVGTNGEIVVGNRDWMVCASASAGPAFEGAGTRHGMRAMNGAIDHIQGWAGPGGFSYSVLGDAPPAGLCGTAYVDLVAVLLRMGVIDKTGQFDTSSGHDRLKETSENEYEFVVVQRGEKGAEREIVITQADLDNLLRAKGAIYAASKILLSSLGINVEDLARIMVAGAFGNYLDMESAVFIGLLPDVDPEKLQFAGNTALAGAKMVSLNRERYRQARRIAQGMTYFELSTEPAFMEEFTSACFLPHTNVEEFPTVQVALAGRKERS